jgi:hypothetical protein
MIPLNSCRLEGSERRRKSGARWLKYADKSEHITTTVLLRRKSAAYPPPPAIAPYPIHVDSEEFASVYGASERDLESITHFARTFKFEVVESNIARRTVVLSGTVEQVTRAFATNLGHYEDNNEIYRGREGYIHVPRELADVVKGVFGLDNRKMGGRNGLLESGTLSLICDQGSLHLVDHPTEWRFAPAGWPARLLGLAGGYGLRANVRGLYQELSRLYEGPDDRIYLFGFSRGAFTVRVLAGLLYRCGLPGNAVKTSDGFFDEAYQLYRRRGQEARQIDADDRKVAAFRKKYPHVRDPEVHFLGVWDTVKSYGVIWPRILPYLRHNPAVIIVRHALALNERRSWFNATTWGQLDLDERGAKTRLNENDLPRYKRQDILEVWFRGCHSDIGGGDVEENTARIALRWMLGEAHAAGLRLGPKGDEMLGSKNPRGPVEIHESLRGCWWLTEYFPRFEIVNSGKYPIRKFACSGTGRRNPDGLRRNGKVWLRNQMPASCQSCR